MIERYENEIIFLANEALSKFLSTMYRERNWSISLEKKISRTNSGSEK